MLISYRNDDRIQHDISAVTQSQYVTIRYYYVPKGAYIAM